jgi:hydroxyacylglutathione hydrolase
MSEILVIPAANDNYIYLIVDGKKAAVIDPTTAEPVMEALVERGLGLEYVLITHGHGDHVGGVKALQRYLGSRLIGPEGSFDDLDEVITDNAIVSLGTRTIRFITTPGHTHFAASYYLVPDENDKAGAVFTGDTMFIGGCGRISEGDAETMFHSLKKLAALPEDTRVYPGHEYTLENYEFAALVAPGDVAVHERLVEVKALYEKVGKTMPSTIAQERATNVFLRAQSVQVFAELRRRKDVF